MHALFIAGWWPTKESPVNGVFIKEHAEAISKFAKVTVVYVKSIEKSESLLDFSPTIKQEIIDVNKNLQILIFDLKLKIRKFGLLEKKMNYLIFKLIKQFNNNIPIDLIHVNVLNTPFTMNVISNSNCFKLPIILTEHSSFYHTEIFDLPMEKIETKKQQLIIALNNPIVKFILPVSVQLGEVLVENYNVSPSKVINIPNVANDVFLATPISNNINSTNIVIFAAAIWNTPKNPLLFFSLLTMLKQREFEIYKLLKINWAGEGLQMAEVKSFVNKHLLDLKINFFGLLSKASISEQMSVSCFLVHPTDAENLPCIIIESLCAGLPVLTSKVNGNIELITKDNGLLYDAENIEDFYIKFIEMITNINKFNKEKIAENAREKYSSLAIGRQIVDIYYKAKIAG